MTPAQRGGWFDSLPLAARVRVMVISCGAGLVVTVAVYMVVFLVFVRPTLPRILALSLVQIVPLQVLHRRILDQLAVPPQGAQRD